MLLIIETAGVHMKIIICLIYCFLLMITTNNVDAHSANEYVMQCGDKLLISVYNHPELTKENGSDGNSDNTVMVAPNGKINLFLLGEVVAMGKTVSELTAELASRYKVYVNNPFVTINILELGSTKVYVLGEIGRQGVYELTKSHNLLDAIAAAQGFLSTSAKKNIFVIRAGEKEVSEKINLNELFLKGDKNKNIVLNTGDAVYITKNNKITIEKDVLPYLRGILTAQSLEDN